MELIEFVFMHSFSIVSVFVACAEIISDQLLGKAMNSFVSEYEKR